jgi:Mrp family chromosome partitioning ATPase
MHGGGEKIAKDMGIEFIGKIPLDQRICESSDRGGAIHS